MPPSPRVCVARMSAYIPGEAGSPRAVKLNQNENPYPPSPAAAPAAAAAMARMGRYPDSRSTPLRRAAAETYGAPEACVMAFNGSDELLRLLFETFVDPGGAIVMFNPGYTYYRTLADMHGAETRLVELTDDYALPPAADIARALAGAKLLFITNPNAPSGTAFPEAELLELCGMFPDGIVCVDEAYADFYGETLIPRVAERGNLVVARTFSKGYGLAGLRVGLGFAPPELAAAMEKVRDYYNLDVLAQAAAAAALRDQAYLRTTVGKIVKTRDRLSRALAELGFRVWPSSANFVLARHPGGTEAARALFEALRRREVLVRYFTAPRLADCLRITVGTDAENDCLLARLEELTAGCSPLKNGLGPGT